MNILPRRLAGPGDADQVWAALEDNGWGAVDWPPAGTGMASRSLNAFLVFAERRGEMRWLLSANPNGPLQQPRWTATFSRTTPAEILAQTLGDFAQRLTRDRAEALHASANLRGIFDSLQRADWEEVFLYDGEVCSTAPGTGAERLELWHRPTTAWNPDDLPDSPTTTLSVGARTANPSDTEPLWWAQFSRQTPAHLVTSALTATTAAVPATRHLEQIPQVNLEAITTDAADDAQTPPRPTEEAQAHDTVATILDWDMTEDEIGNFTLQSPCGRVIVAHTPLDRHDVQWQSTWTITVTADHHSEATHAPLRSWKARFSEHTPYTVVGAVTSEINKALITLDSLEVHDDFETSPEPSFTPHRLYRPDPVPGSRDPALAHARLRLLGWTGTDDSRARTSTGPDLLRLWSVHRGEATSLHLVPPPEAWTLDGGQPPNLWTATFDPGTPTFLVHAAASEAARQAQRPVPAPPAEPLSRHTTRAEAARTTSSRTGPRSTAADIPADPSPPAAPSARSR